eukprot:g18735.t1
MQMVTTVAEWGAAPVRQKRWERLNHSCKIIITAGLRFTLAKGVLTTFFLMCPPKKTAASALAAAAAKAVEAAKAKAAAEAAAKAVAAKARKAARSDVDMQRLYLVDDWLSTAPQERQWRPQTPSSNSAGSFGMESNYWDAQSRQLEFMQKHPNVKSLGFPHPIKLDPEAHANDWEKEEDRLALMWHNAIAVDIFRALRFCGVVLLHTPSMVPHALSYLPYSTYRRSHPPSVATSMSIGNIASREQMWALSQLVTRRACSAQRRVNKALQMMCRPMASAWKLPLHMRMLGGESAYNFSRENWRLPGACFLGQSLVAFRSEHFLPDAQAAGLGSITSSPRT